MRTVTSPENRSTSSKHLFVRLLQYFFSPIYKRIRQRVLFIRWRHHYHPDQLKWDWAESHYNRIALVNYLAARTGAEKYLEIGCAGNALFDSVPIKNKIGVDPTNGGTHRMTSDEYFACNAEKFDLIFIDGLHTYEQVRKDVQNSIAALREGGWVVLHDMIPMNWIEEHIPIISIGDWVGDVWKVGFELANTEGVDFRIIRIDHGIGVFRLKIPNPKLKDMRASIDSANFGFFYENLSTLPIIEWSDFLNWSNSSINATQNHQTIP